MRYTSGAASRSGRLPVLCTLFLTLAACTAIPMHESATPETLGRGGVRLGLLGIGIAPTMFVTPEEDEAAEYRHYPDHTKEGTCTISHALAVGLGDRLDGEIGFYYGFNSYGWGTGLKYQWLGSSRIFSPDRGTFSSSIALRFLHLCSGQRVWEPGYGEDVEDIFHGRGTSFQVSLPTGYRLASWFTVYLAPKVVWGGLQASFRDYPEAGCTTQVQKDYAGYGGSVGVGIHPHGERGGFELRFELYRMNLPLMTDGVRGMFGGGVLTMALPLRVGGR